MRTLLLYFVVFNQAVVRRRNERLDTVLTSGRQEFDAGVARLRKLVGLEVGLQAEVPDVRLFSGALMLTLDRHFIVVFCDRTHHQTQLSVLKLRGADVLFTLLVCKLKYF